MLQLLKESLEESPVIKIGDYDYFVHPITDGVPEIRPELLNEIVGEIKNHLIRDYDKLIAIEAMGLPVGVALAMNMNKPLVVIRKKSYGFESEVSVNQITGYSKTKLFINGLEPNDKVVLIDDVLSTGGTLRSVINALTEMGVELIDVVVVIEKGNNKYKVEQATGQEITTMVKIEIENGRVILLDG